MKSSKPVDRFCQTLEGNHDLTSVIDAHVDLVHLAAVNRHITSNTDLNLVAQSNTEIWRHFVTEQLYDTRRVKLEYFHLFEWFPIKPGKFHTVEAEQQRTGAYNFAIWHEPDEPDSPGIRGRGDFADSTYRYIPEKYRSQKESLAQVYFNPEGKASMIRGGVGAVRLRPRQINGEWYYFMTASSSGVCHEGFPVLIPRRLYGALKVRMLNEGAVPVILTGEMRYVPNDILTFFGNDREIPLLYLHVDDVQDLPNPRSEVSSYIISAVLSFAGAFEDKKGEFVTYANFDPASKDSFQQACNWLKEFYVKKYAGTIITDFDEVQPRFPAAIFGLPNLMSGKLDKNRVQAFLHQQGLSEKTVERFFVVYGDYISVGDITDSENIAIGRNAQATDL